MSHTKDSVSRSFFLLGRLLSRAYTTFQAEGAAGIAGVLEEERRAARPAPQVSVFVLLY